MIHLNNRVLRNDGVRDDEGDPSFERLPSILREVGRDAGHERR
jgi:hypothetical protein